ncbi:MAG TPA: recombinase family protein [Ktedonobacterales bacterium]|nr:recombinase family protein [Ktedonobacterales bacterium]
MRRSRLKSNRARTSSHAWAGNWRGTPTPSLRRSPVSATSSARCWTRSLSWHSRGQIDVIVAREFERVARVKMRRWAAISIALDFGVEFRFANLPPDGRLPDSREGKMYMAFAEEFGEMERERIIERTAPGMERRRAAGMPSGGRVDRPLATNGDPRPKGRRATLAL